MINAAKRVVVIIAATISGAACENLRVVHYTDTMGEVSTLTTDAKQRIMLNVPAQQPEDGLNQGYNTPKRIVCTEPSPDVAQAISEALQAGVKADVAVSAASGSTHTVGAAGNVGRSVSASIAQLGERLAAIQLLRDKMYRACEAYANGAVSATGYTLMLARLDKTMVTMLSNELAAGAFGRALAQLDGNASSGGVPEAEVQKQENVVKQKASALQQAAKDKKPDEEIKAASDALNAEVEKLAWLQRLASSTSAASSGSAPGSIANGGTRGTEAGSVALIHRNFIDDDGVEPLVDACITGLDRVDGKKIAADAEKRRTELRQAQQTELERLHNELSQLRQSLDDTDYQLSQRRPLFDGDRDLQREKRNIQSMINSKINEIERKRANLVTVEQDKRDDLEEALLKGNYPFAALCYRNVLNSGFVAARAAQKKALRGLENEEKRMGLVSQTLDLCKAFQAGTFKVADDQKKEFQKACIAAMTAASGK